MFQQVILEKRQHFSWIHSLLLVLGGSFLIALFARIAIPLPFSPVPLATQPHVCLLLGALLGSRRGSLAVLVYLFQGAIGLPVFSMGKAGLGVLLGPTGGYLMGYLVATWMTGYLIERLSSTSQKKMLLMMTLGNLAIYLCGVAQLAFFIGIERAALLGMVPFLIGDALKLMVISRLARSFAKFKS